MVTYYWFPEPCNTCVALKQHLTVTNPVRNQKLLQRVCGLLNGRLVMWIQAESAATNKNVQSNLSYPDSCYPGTSLNRAADSLYFMLILQKFWAVQWVWPVIAYIIIFILYSEIRTNLSYGHPLIPMQGARIREVSM